MLKRFVIELIFTVIYVLQNNNMLVYIVNTAHCSWHAQIVVYVNVLCLFEFYQMSNVSYYFPVQILILRVLLSTLLSFVCSEHVKMRW